MDNYPITLIDQYLKTSNKLKKFDRVVFKRFAPNVSEVYYEFNHLAIKFEEAGIHQYAAMCHLGASKCEKFMGNTVCEVNSYLKTARAFIKADKATTILYLRSNRREYIEGALRAYNLALSRISDEVLQAAVIREITTIDANFDTTSSFVSPSHRIYDLQISAHRCLEEQNFFPALEKLTDIIDNIYERKKQHLYTDLLREIEISRLLLLILLNLPPSRQSPSHIKLIEFYFNFENFQHCDDGGTISTASDKLSMCQTDIGKFNSLEMKYVLSNVVNSWCERNDKDLKSELEQLLEFVSLTQIHRFLVLQILEQIN